MSADQWALSDVEKILSEVNWTDDEIQREQQDETINFVKKHIWHFWFPGSNRILEIVCKIVFTNVTKHQPKIKFKKKQSLKLEVNDM